MSILKIPTARVFLPLLSPARYKGARGGRGSGKSHFFAERLVEEAASGHIRAACLREVQSSIKDSVKRPGGPYFGCRFGRNTSSDAGRHQDAYTTMTNFLAASLNAFGGQFVGQVMTPDEIREAQSAIGAFLGGMQNPTGSPPKIAGYSVSVTGNNATGVQTAVVMVQYLGVVEYFVINLTGGQTVQIGQTAAQQALAA